MNRAELEAAEQMIMEECLTGGVALTSKWDTLHGKINFVTVSYTHLTLPTTPYV